MAGRPKGSQNKDKPFRDALRMEKCALENGEVIEHPRGSLRWNAQRLLMSGEIANIKELADRLDGRVPQAVVGSEEDPPVRFEGDLGKFSPDQLRALRAIFIGIESAGD